MQIYGETKIQALQKEYSKLIPNRKKNNCLQAK